MKCPATPPGNIQVSNIECILGWGSERLLKYKGLKCVGPGHACSSALESGISISYFLEKKKIYHIKNQNDFLSG